jgi:hypothetical protein
MVKGGMPLRGMHPSRFSASPGIAGKSKRTREKDNAETLRAPRFRRRDWERGDEIGALDFSLQPKTSDGMRVVVMAWDFRQCEFLYQSIKKLRRAGMQGTYNSRAMGNLGYHL